jgi:hypothetical protein
MARCRLRSVGPCSASRDIGCRDRCDRLDSVGLPVLIDEGDHYFGRRSSSAWAKNAAAFLRISLARFSSPTSRWSRLNSSRSGVVRPGRLPPSRSAWRTHRRSASVVHRVSRRRIESWPTATGARGRGQRPSARRAHVTQGHTCWVVPSGPSSLGMGPPINPVRFISPRTADACDGKS